MTNRTYARYVQPLRLRTEVIYPSFRGKISDFSLVSDEQTQPECPLWIETYHAYAPGTEHFPVLAFAVTPGAQVKAVERTGTRS